MDRDWLTMWVSPQSTVKRIIENQKHGSTMYVIVYAWALENLFFYAHAWSLGLGFSVYTIVILSLLLAYSVGRVWLWAIGGVFFFTGRGLGGQATLQQVRIAVTWSNIPELGVVASWIGMLLLAPREVFIEPGSGDPRILFFNLANVAFAVWASILMVRSFQAIQNFSAWRAIANLIIGWVLFSIPLTLLIHVILFFMRF